MIAATTVQRAPESHANSFLIITEDFATARKNVLDRALKDGSFVIYVSFNKPCSKLGEFLKGGGIAGNRSFLLSTVKGPSHPEYADFRLLEPGNLTDLSIIVSELYDSVAGQKSLVIDSLDNLFIYNEPNPILQFVYTLLERSAGRGADVYVLSAPLERSEFKQAFSMFDKVLRR